MIDRKLAGLARAVTLGLALATPVFGVPVFEVPVLKINEAAAARPQAADISREERAEINRIERYLNGMTTLQARFVQVSSNGQFAEGSLYISRPGKLRIEYDPPVPVLIVTDGRFLIYYDKQLEQVSHIPLGSTPASILTRPNISLTGGDLILTGFESKGETLSVTVVQASDPYSGRVSLIFDKDPLALSKWTVVDAQGIETDVSLRAAQVDVALDQNLFRFRDPRIFKDGF
jgi:outer membrane lipoprotein-sorting protein